MSRVAGIDLSSRAIDLVRLDENSSRADWTRCEPPGEHAWERTMRIPQTFTDGLAAVGYWDDVYLVAIEEPFARVKGKSLLILNRVVGAVVASLPPELRVPERCWLVAPHEWKAGLGLKGKPSPDDIERIAGTANPFTGSEFREPASENARDAYCIAMWARDLNAKGVAAA